MGRSLALLPFALLIAANPDVAGAGPGEAWALATRAEVAAPDGIAFTTVLVSLPDGTALLEQFHPEGDTRLLVDGGGRVFAGDGEGTWQPAEPEMADYVHGHDALRLFREAASEGRDPGTLVRPLPPALGGGEVRLTFAAPVPVLGHDLPTAAVFHHEGQAWRYRYTEVLPFLPAPGAPLPAAPAALAARLRDLAEIARVHARGLAAHRQGDLAMLLADEAPRGLVSGRGRLRETTSAETGAALGPYLATTTFARYEDVVPPRITVAADGSLAWLACEIEAEGVQEGPDGSAPLTFGYSWVELLARDGARWVRVGNAASARP